MPDLVKCITCKNWNLRAAGKMAAHGFGKCSRDFKWRYFGASFERVCAKQVAATADVVESRRKWLGGKRD